MNQENFHKISEFGIDIDSALETIRKDYKKITLHIDDITELLHTSKIYKPTDTKNILETGLFGTYQDCSVWSSRYVPRGYVRLSIAGQ